MMRKSNYPTKFLKFAFTYLSPNLVILVFSLVRKLRSLHSVLVFSSSIPFLRATPVKSRSVSLVNNTTQGITSSEHVETILNHRLSTLSLAGYSSFLHGLHLPHPEGVQVRHSHLPLLVLCVDHSFHQVGDLVELHPHPDPEGNFAGQGHSHLTPLYY